MVDFKCPLLLSLILGQKYLSSKIVGCGAYNFNFICRLFWCKSFALPIICYMQNLRLLKL